MGFFKKEKEIIEIVKMRCPVCKTINNEEEEKCIECGLDFTDDIVAAPVECDCKARQAEYIKDIDAAQKEKKQIIKERDKAMEELKNVQLDKKITVEDIKHQQKLLDEKNALDVDRKIFEAEKKAEEEIKSIRKEYADKLEKELTSERKKMQEFMQQVMAALPNVNVKLKG